MIPSKYVDSPCNLPLAIHNHCDIVPYMNIAIVSINADGVVVAVNHTPQTSGEADKLLQREAVKLDTWIIVKDGRKVLERPLHKG